MQLRFPCLVIATALASAATRAQATLHVPLQFATIQAAIQAAQPGDTVLVAPGTYAESIDFLGKGVAVRSSAGPTQTTIRGNGQQTVVRMVASEPRTAILQGFTITGGRGGATSLDVGGGVSVVNAAPTIRDNVITNNDSLLSGAGVGVASGAAWILDNVITGNRCTGSVSTSGGAGVYLSYGGGNFVIGNVISRNTALAVDGGGIRIHGRGSESSSYVIGNVVDSNQARFGGGIYAETAAVVIQNLVVNNVATQGGGGLAHMNGSLILVSNTIAYNSALGGSAFWSGGSGDLHSHLYANNLCVAVTGSPAWLSPARSLPVFNNNNVHAPGLTRYGGGFPDLTGQFGNLSADPLLRNPTSADYGLTRASPCVDAGDNSAPLLQTHDLFGDPRMIGVRQPTQAVVDIGVDEFSGLSQLGAGCPGSGGLVPTCGAMGLPTSGNATFGISVSGGLGGASGALLLGSSSAAWQGMSLPFQLGVVGMPTCSLWNSIDIALAVTLSGTGAGAGQSSVALPLPAGLPPGSTAYAQWLIGDPGPTLIPGAMTTSLEMEVF